MTVFRLGLSMFQIDISWFWRIFILSSLHRPLLSLTLVLICWLGGTQGWCCESCAEVCMRAFELPPGALYRRAYWCEVGLCRLVGLRPVFQGLTFPLAMFLAIFLLDCVCWFVTASGVLRVVAVGELVLWEDEAEECGWHFECVWIKLSFPCCMCRSTMTRVITTEVDVVLMRKFLEEARLAFLMVPVGARMEEVNAFFWH
jgi:hypothetical protein